MEEKKTVKQNNVSEMRRAVLDAINDRGEISNKKYDAENEFARSEKQKENTASNPSRSSKTENKSNHFNDKNKTVKIKKRKKIGFGKCALIFLSIILLILFVFGVGIFRYGWNGNISKAMLKFIPYPAAIVGSDLILYKDYDYILRTALNGQQYSQSESDFANKEEVSAKVLDRLIINKIIKNIALKYEINISDEDINRSFTEYAKQFNSEEEFINTLKELYLWDINDFKSRIIYPILLQNRVNNYIVWSDDFNQDRIDSANKILNELKFDSSDKKFIELVSLHSEDFASVKNSGDLGWFEKGAMVKEFDDAAFSLQIGEISEIVRTQFGFHIIKLDGRKDDKIKARHILIKARGLEEVLQEKKKEIRIWKFVKF